MSRSSIGLRLAAVAFGLSAIHAASAQTDSLRTVAEESRYEATSKYTDVISFGERLAKASPVVRLAEMGTSNEGRKLPLWILADPPVADPESAKKSGKL